MNERAQKLHERLEEQRRNAQSRYESVVQMQTDLIVRYRGGGILTFVNRAYARYFDSSPETLVGTCFLDRIPEDERADVEAKIEGLQVDGPPLVDTHCVERADGGFAWHEWVDRAIRLESGAVEYQAVGRDVTERIERESALREALHEAVRLRSELEVLRDRLFRENAYLRGELGREKSHGTLVGESEVWHSMLIEIERVAQTDATTLVLGETGSGKELIARAIHERSARAEGPLITVNAALLRGELLESELFGHVKGAFTGATEKRMGRFELASGGTLFIDEVGELPLSTQAKLLRVLEEREITPLGGSAPRPIDVRIIAATHRELEVEVRDGRFRADLFYRLNVYPISAPPLRERGEDVSLLLHHFVGVFGARHGKRIERIDPAAIEACRRYSWPGNVRELQNVVERAVIRCSDGVLQLPTLAEPNYQHSASGGESLAEVERAHIERVLGRTGGVIGGARGAARILGLHENTLRSRMKRLGIPLPRSTRGTKSRGRHDIP